MIRVVLFFLMFLCLSAKAQVDPVRLSSGNVDHGKWEKMGRSIRKALSKDTLNSEARYLMALFCFNPSHAEFNTDSAYYYVRGSWKNYKSLLPPAREKLKKVPLDSAILFALKSRIDSAAFEKAKRTNTIEGYQYFIGYHAGASQTASAIELRDEVAFLEALKINTWTSFQKFMKAYPKSHRSAEAEERFDKLLYEDKTRDQKLHSFVSFYKSFPESPYRDLALKNIFELSTVSGFPESFHAFAKNYPNTAPGRRARNILYTMRAVDGDDVFDAEWMTDSLRNVEKLNEPYWVPVFKSGLYGFIDATGDEAMSLQFHDVSEDYRCGNVTERVLVTSKGLIGRDGRVLLNKKLKNAESLGQGFIAAVSDSGKYVLHESGFRIGKNTVDDAQLLANRFIGLQKNKKWSVVSLAGRPLLPAVYDDLDAMDSLIILTKNGKKTLTTVARITREEKGESKEQYVYDDVRRWANRQYWVRLGVMEGVMDANLNFIIPLDRQILRKASFGFLREKEKRLFIQGIAKYENIPYQSVFEQGNWVRMQNAKGEYVLYEKTFRQQVTGDSAWFKGQIAFVTTGDSINAYMPSGQKLSFHEKAPFRLMESKDSSAWLVLEEKKKKAVYDAASGLKLFSADFDQIEPAGQKIFLITKANKKGLVGEDGKVLIPVEFDAIVSDGTQGFSLLKDKKFGWYDSRTKQLLKPQYDRNVKPYNHQYRLAFREKGYAFIKPDGAPIGNYEWEDAQYWNDSTAWVKKNFQWMLVVIPTQKVKLDKVRTFSSILDSPAEKIFFVSQEHQMGVISSRKGVIIPLQYSDVINLGTPEVPLYFTERHIEEAGISVVVYFDQRGKVVRKQAMESEEFDRIACDN